jgi:hypothetical protein
MKTTFTTVLWAAYDESRMEVLGVDRVLIATPDTEATRGVFNDLLGIEFGKPIVPEMSTREGRQSVIARMSNVGIELIEPKEEGDALDDYLDEYGSGLYSIDLRVVDLDAAKRELREKGYDPIVEIEPIGSLKEASYHPDLFENTMITLVEYTAPHPAESATSVDSAD